MPGVQQRQTFLTSATFPADVQHLAQDFMGNYTFMAVGRVGGTVSTIKQKLVWVEDTDKDDFVFGLLLRQKDIGLTLIFVNTKQAASDLQHKLRSNNLKVDSIHGDRTQA